MDSALGLQYPRNKLTEYLFELRNYRPASHQNYIFDTYKSAQENNVKGYGMEDSTSALYLLKAMHQTFKFRHLHWTMVRKYIIQNTKHPVATGGTPITTWLPNQMGACLEMC